METKDELIINEHLRLLGKTRESIPQKRWEQLCIIYKAIKSLEIKRNKLNRLQKESKITIANIERIVNETLDYHISHALFFQKNKDGLLNRFITTFIETPTPKETNETKYKKQISLLEKKIKLLAGRDYRMLLLEEDIDTLKKELKKNNIPLPELNIEKNAAKNSMPSGETSMITSMASSKTKGSYS